MGLQLLFLRVMPLGSPAIFASPQENHVQRVGQIEKSCLSHANLSDSRVRSKPSLFPFCTKCHARRSFIVAIQAKLVHLAKSLILC